VVDKNYLPKCFQCKAELIFVSQERVQLEGSLYPQINTVYRCSNEECQKKKDKEKAERQKVKLNKVEMEKERIKKIQEKRRRRLGIEIKTQEN